MKLQHIITTQQLLKIDLVEEIFNLADKFKKLDSQKKTSKILNNKLLATVFYEPSTRTRFSFESAMLKLGGGVVTTESAGHFSSAIKGESLEDTIRVLGGYVDAIVLRHPDVGASKKAVAVSQVPIINAGDGSDEHPTQALLDLYTIKKELGRINNFSIAMVGDLLYGRTIHSLIYLFSLCRDIKIFLVSPPELKLPVSYKTFIKKQKIDFVETENLNDVLPQINILYVTRIQKERFGSVGLYEKVKNSFVINKKNLKLLKKDAVIMHPLPRVSEINSEIDSDPRAAYFRQAQNGLYIRMALLDLVLRGR